MSIFIFKLIACITMVFDHIKYAIPETRNFLTMYMGRISFPLFAFLLVEGYMHTSNLKKYYKRLLITAVISQVPFMLFRTLVGEWRMLNIIFTLLFGLNAIIVLDKCSKKYISIPSALLFVFLGKLLHVDYDWWGVSVIILFYIFRKLDRKYLMILAFAFLNVVRYYNRFEIDFESSLYSCVFTTFSAVLLLFYNGKLGPKLKYFYYVFYPVHMLVLYLINLCS